MNEPLVILAAGFLAFGAFVGMVIAHQHNSDWFKPLCVVTVVLGLFTIRQVTR